MELRLRYTSPDVLGGAMTKEESRSRSTSPEVDWLVANLSKIDGIRQGVRNKEEIKIAEGRQVFPYTCT